MLALVALGFLSVAAFCAEMALALADVRADARLPKLFGLACLMAALCFAVAAGVTPWR